MLQAPVCFSCIWSVLFVFLWVVGLSNDGSIFEYYSNCTKNQKKIKIIRLSVLHLHIDSNHTVSCPTPPSYPFSHLEESVAEIIIPRKTWSNWKGPTTWLSPIVLIQKPKNLQSVRICVDMRLPNTTSLQEQHISQTVEGIIHDLNDAAIFSKLDLNAD